MRPDSAWLSRGSATQSPSTLQQFTLPSPLVRDLKTCRLTTGVCAGIEDLREKREEVHRQLMEEESERQKLTSELQQIQRRLNQINESITRKVGPLMLLFLVLLVFRLKSSECCSAVCSLPHEMSTTRWYKKQKLPT